MEPYKAKSLPFEYTLSSELLKLLVDANQIYGEYKGYLIMIFIIHSKLMVLRLKRVICFLCLIKTNLI